MKSFMSGDKIILRLERGEEIIASITKLCIQKRIKSGMIIGIGALKSAEIGRYLLKEKKFIKKQFEGEFEIVSLIGNVSVLQNNEINIHLHIALADNELNLFGGHLAKGEISATAEIFIYPETVELKRIFDKETGLNLIM